MKGSYLKTIYFREETEEHKYPQKLCDHLAEKYLSELGDIKGKKMLDVGSGKGVHLVCFQRRGIVPSGIDKRAECVNAKEGFDLQACDIEHDRFPYDDDTFDFVFSKSVIEHVFNVENFVDECLRVLKPGGMALLMTPDWRSQQAYYYDDYTHVKPWTRKGLQNCLTIKGFERSKCDYLYQLPYLWKFPWLEFLPKLVALLPDSLRFKDKEESDFRTWIRFSKEKMLVCAAFKPTQGNAI